MRKLGIVIALSAAATLGIAGTASAQVDPPVDPPVDAAAAQDDAQNVAEAVGCPPANATPLGAQAPGGACTGYPVPTPDQAGITKYVCGVVNSVNTLTKNNFPAPLNVGYEGAPANPATDAIKSNCKVDTDCAKTNTCPTDKGKTNTNGGGGGGGGNAAVQAANAGGDGSLPRTGGELFAGAGFGLMSLGALVRRFLP